MTLCADVFMVSTGSTSPDQALKHPPRETLRAGLVARGAFLLPAIETRRNELQQPAAAQGDTRLSGTDCAMAE